MAFVTTPLLRPSQLRYPQSLPLRRPASASPRFGPCCTAPTPSTMPTPSLPPRIIPSPVPVLYVYDHCPFCVRVRHLLGLKNVKYNLVFLANDDVESPTALVGRKIVPIFQPHGPDGTAQSESLDICQAIDKNPLFGPPGCLKPATPRDDITKWMDDLAMPMRRLSRVRFSRAPLPEFVFRDAREAYIRNHPLKDPDSYEENFRRSPEYVNQVQERLDELATMIHSPQHCSPHGLSYDDIVLFPRLRTLTIMKGIVLPKRVREYVEFHAAAAEIPLYDFCAM